MVVFNDKDCCKGRFVAKRNLKNQVETFYYQCTMSGRRFKTNRQAPRPDELVSVAAYYELNPEEDDRPAKIKMQQLESTYVSPETEEDESTLDDDVAGSDEEDF